MEHMQPRPPLPGDGPGARRPHRPVALIVLVLVISLVVLAGMVWAAWALVLPRLTHSAGGGAKPASPLEIRPVTSTKPGACPSGGPGVNGADVGGPTCFQLGTGMTVAKVAEARAESGTGGWLVDISLNTQDATRFTALTRKYQNHRLALVTGGKVVSAPTVREPIAGGRVQIAGNLTGDEAKKIARSLGG
jgi:preprotein translocase subunit SecD